MGSSASGPPAPARMPGAALVRCGRGETEEREVMRCRDAARLVSERLERPPGWRREWALRMHLALCAGCRHYRAQIHWLHARLRGEWRLETPVSLEPAARRRILAQLRAAPVD